MELWRQCRTELWRHHVSLVAVVALHRRALVATVLMLGARRLAREGLDGDSDGTQARRLVLDEDDDELGHSRLSDIEYGC